MVEKVGADQNLSTHLELNRDPGLDLDLDRDLDPGTKSKQVKKRSNYLEWQEYFMSIAFLSAQRSKDPNTQVGACIVDKENKVVGIGYNGMPVGCSDDIMPWNRAENNTKEKWLESKSPFVCHAELNAVLNKNQSSVKDCSIYVTLFPCNVCAQIIIQSGISEVVYYSDKYHTKPEFEASRFLLDTAGVKHTQFSPRQIIVKLFQLIEGIQGLASTLPAVECDNSEREDSIENFPPQLPLQNQVQSNDGFVFNFAVFFFLFLIILVLFSWY